MFYRSLIKPLFFRMDPERVHDMTASVLANRMSRPLLALNRLLQPSFDPILKTELCGIPLEHPIGLAAGFDKNGLMVPQMHLLGFAFAEVGTVTAQAQPGNPKPRIFRLPEDRALINRLGFNNEGARALAQRLATHKVHLPVGGNIGKSKITPLADATTDYAHSFRLLQPLVRYFVINVSSPNTPGLRKLQAREPLNCLLSHLNSLNQKPRLPLFLKIAPDLSDQELADIIEVVSENGLDGVIATNTTTERSLLRTPQTTVEMIGAGGLSGQPLQQRSTQIIARLRRELPANAKIIGVGGIFTGQDAYEKIKLGADCVQIYTGFIYRGPATVFRIARELADLLKRDGFTNLGQAVGVEARVKTL